MPPVPAADGAPGRLASALADPITFVRWLLLDPAATVTLSLLILLAEIVLNVGVIQMVPCEYRRPCGCASCVACGCVWVP